MESRICSQFKSFMVMDILERACALEREGKKVVHLEVGQPDFPTPDCVKDAACKAIRDGQIGYTHSLGLVELREAISEHYVRKYDVSVHPDRIVVTPGTSPAMLLAMSAAVDRGDKVVLTDPHYACYPNFVRFVGGEPLFVPVAEDQGFHLTRHDVASVGRRSVKAVMINSPGNPTGTVIPRDRLEMVCSSGLTVLSDEIYHGLVYEGKEHTALEFTDNCFVFNGFSKLYAMTGWRLGYVIAPAEHMGLLQKLQQSFIISTNAVSQWAGIAALTGAGEDVARMKKIFNTRRTYMIHRLREMGFGLAVEPVGAFYVFVNANHIEPDSVKLAYDILEKAHVGVTPGKDFGEGGEGFLRFSYANSMENIEEGLDRIEQYLSKR